MADYTTENKVILFTDLHHYSVVVERIGVEAVNFIQRFYVLFGDLVSEHGGRIVKYIGDSALAIFDEGSELAAVEMGVAIRRRYRSLAAEYGVQEQTEAEIGIGAGAVVTGIFGHPALRVFDIHGNAVNEAAIICHHLGVAMTRAVYDAVRGSVECRKLPDATAKWRDTPLEQWEVVESG